MTHSSKTIQVERSPQQRHEDEEATPPSQRGSLVVPPNSSTAAAPTPPTPSAPCVSVKAEGKIKDLRLPTPAPRNGGEGKFSIGACTGLRYDRGGSNSSLAVEDEGRKAGSSWETRTPKNAGDVVMSWGADEEHGGGPITPKTALRFKKSAIARVMHN